MKNATTDHYFGVGIGLDAIRRSINLVLICQTGTPIVPRGVNTHVCPWSIHGMSLARIGVFGVSEWFLTNQLTMWSLNHKMHHDLFGKIVKIKKVKFIRKRIKSELHLNSSLK